MKNTLFFDDDFLPELLENEETTADETRNTIWFRFTTSAATNQKLQITVRSTLYEIPIASSTAYNYQLVGQFWPAGGITSVRLTNDEFTSEYIYITFPDIISTDAALQQTEDGSAEYYLQGKTDDAFEIKSATASYRTGRDYYIDTLTRFVQFVFASRTQQATGLLTLTATITCSGITDTAKMRFHIRTNLVFDEVFIPTQDVKNGTYIVTICYPVENIAQSDRNSVDVYLEMSDGLAEIKQGEAIATLTGAGVVPSEKFIGLIELIDITQLFTIPDGDLTIEPATESITPTTQVPIGDMFSETVAEIALPEISITDMMTDTVRIVNYGGSQERVLEDDETERVTEGGADYRYTEEET